MGPGGSPGLQNRWRRARRGVVGSTPTRSRHGVPMSSKPAVRPRPPSVEAVLSRLRASANGTDPAALSGVARAVVDEERANLAAGVAARDPEALAAEALGRLGGFAEPGLLPVINATGVIIHTNLGRAPWPNASASAVADL